MARDRRTPRTSAAGAQQAAGGARPAGAPGRPELRCTALSALALVFDREPEALTADDLVRSTAVLAAARHQAREAASTTAELAGMLADPLTPASTCTPARMAEMAVHLSNAYLAVAALLELMERANHLLDERRARHHGA